MPTTQIFRPFRFKTPLGDDALILESFTGYERVSTPFHYILRVLAPDPNIKMRDLLTKPGVITYVLSESGDPEETERHIHGHITRMKMLEIGDDGMAAYEIEMVAGMNFLHQCHGCRIFQNKTAVDIIEAIFKERKLDDYKLDLQGTFPTREYTVQYRETDFNFVSRLMEEEGIWYYFEQSKEKHTLVLADDPSKLQPCPKMPTAHYAPATGGTAPEDSILHIEAEYQVTTGAAAQTDYDFEKPKSDLYTTLDGAGQNSYQRGEFYDYPGFYKTKAEGDRYNRIRLEEREAGMNILRGETNCLGLECGYKFNLQDHPRDEANQDYMIVAVEHRGKNPSYSSHNKDESYEYSNTIEAIPSSVTFRPPRLARKPVIYGTQTAVVVGKSGEEIWTDKYGRVIVQFHWDREGKMDEKSSCWIRVSQGWAGKKWGIIHIPRIGQEVVVTFLEGDPDRPLITGSVYNADQEVPYALPGESTKSTMKSNSSKGSAGFNEIRIEDKKGSEQVFIHGEKDLDIRVKNDRKEWIGNDRHLHVVNDKFEQVEKGSSHLHIKKDSITHIEGDRHVKVDGKEAIEITGSQSLKVSDSVAEDFGANQTVKIGANYCLKATQIVMEADAGITLKVGSNFITLLPAGVFIVGQPMVFINSGGSALPSVPGVLVPPLSPTDPKDADDAQAGSMSTPSANPKDPKQIKLDTVDPAKRRKSADSGPSAGPGGAGSETPPPPKHDEKAPENQDKTHWVAIKLVDEDGNPVPGEPYKITLPDGKVSTGTTNQKGEARVEHIDPGSCKVTFPNLDKDAWEPK